MNDSWRESLRRIDEDFDLLLSGEERTSGAGDQTSRWIELIARYSDQLRDCSQSGVNHWEERAWTNLTMCHYEIGYRKEFRNKKGIAKFYYQKALRIASKIGLWGMEQGCRDRLNRLSSVESIRPDEYSFDSLEQLIEERTEDELLAEEYPVEVSFDSNLLNFEFELRYRLHAVNLKVYLPDSMGVEDELIAIYRAYDAMLKIGPRPRHVAMRHLYDQLQTCLCFLGFIYSVSRRDDQAVATYEQSAYFAQKIGKKDRADWLKQQAAEIIDRKAGPDREILLLRAAIERTPGDTWDWAELQIKLADFFLRNNENFEAGNILDRIGRGLQQLSLVEFGHDKPEKTDVFELWSLVNTPPASEGSERFRKLTSWIDNHINFYKCMSLLHRRKGSDPSAEVYDRRRWELEERYPGDSADLLNRMLSTMETGLTALHLWRGDVGLSFLHPGRVVQDLRDIEAENRKRKEEETREDLIEKAKETLAQARRFSNPDLIAAAGLCLARVLLTADRDQEGLVVLEKALQELGDVSLECGGVAIVAEQARILTRSEPVDWKRVSDLCGQGIRWVEASRPQITSPHLAGAYLRSRVELYAIGVRAAYEQGDYDLMLERADLSKSRLVLRYRSAPGDESQNPDAPDLEELRRKFLHVCEQIDSTSTEVEKDDLDLLLTQRRELWDELFIRRYTGRGQGVEATRLAWDNLRTNLQDDEAVLYSYWIDKHLLLLVALDRTTILPELHVLSSEDRRKLDTFSSEILRAADTLGFIKEVRNYSDFLLPKDERTRELLSTKSYIFISPHRTLHALPWHALRWDGHPLIECFAISYIPNLAVLESPTPPPRSSRLLSLGIAKFEVRNEVGVKLGDLPGAEEEAQQIAEIYGDTATKLLGIGASKAELLEEDRLSGYTCLHLATHAGSVLSDHPMESVLYLQDTKLTGLEISELSLDADLIVLAACNSGQRPIRVRDMDELPGDDLFGLQAAFFIAGTRGVIGCLWPVDNMVAPTMMYTLHRELVAGFPAAKALQSAIREQLQRERAQFVTTMKSEVGFDPWWSVDRWGPFFLSSLGRVPSFLIREALKP